MLLHLSGKVAYTCKLTFIIVHVFGAFPEKPSVVEIDPSPKISYKSNCVYMTVYCKRQHQQGTAAIFLITKLCIGPQSLPWVPENDQKDHCKCFLKLNLRTLPGNDNDTAMWFLWPEIAFLFSANALSLVGKYN